MIEILKILISWNDPQLGHLPDPLALRLLCSLRAIGAAAVFWTLTDVLRNAGGPWLVSVTPALFCLTCAFLFAIGIGPAQPRNRTRGIASLLIAGGLIVQNRLLISGAATPLLPLPMHLASGALLFAAALIHAGLCFASFRQAHTAS